MKKKIVIAFFAAMSGLCSFAGTVYSGGCFLEGRWLPDPNNVGTYVKYYPSDILQNISGGEELVAQPVEGYRVTGWRYNGNVTPSDKAGGETFSSWNALNTYVNGEDGSSTNTIPNTYPYAGVFTGNKQNWVVVSLAYVKYEIKFNLNGGSGSIPSMSGLCVTNEVTFSTPGDKTGYDFKNWKAANGNEFAANTPLTPAVALGIAHVDTNFTLTAEWTPHTMSISYELDGGSHGESHPDSATYGEAFKVSAPTKTGYNFVGWSVDGYDNYTAKYGTDSASVNSSLSAGGKYPSNGGDVWFLNLTPEPEDNATVTLTANWEAKTYTVHFDVGGASNNPTLELTVTYDKELPKVPSTPSYSNADFLGFYTQPNGQGEKYWNSDGSPVPSIWTNDVDKMTFYEHKGNERKRIIFHGNGGNPEQVTTNAHVGATYGSIMPTVAWAGGRRTFTGWFTSSEGGDEVTGETLVSAADSDKNLYAHWAVAQYAVRFDGNGATNETEMALQQIYFDSTTPLSPNGYGRPGYTFAGWTTNGASSATVDLADGAAVSNLVSDVSVTGVVYAVWSPNEYYVRFNPNGGIGTAFVWTNHFGTATNYPAADAFAHSYPEYWFFSAWSNTVDGTVSEAGAAFSNLTAEAKATVDVNAVWGTKLSELALAMHCDNLTWTNIVAGKDNQPWEPKRGGSLGYEASGSCVSQASMSLHALQAVVYTNGTLTFYCRTASGDNGTLRIWLNEQPTGYGNANVYTNELPVAAGSEWTKVKLVVPSGHDTCYIRISNWIDGEAIYIDKMTWKPGASSAEPTEEDARNFTEMTVGGGALSLAFEPDAEFAYNLRGTNDLTAARSLWPVLLTTNGSEKISILLPVEAARPCMFYYLETISK